MHMGVFWFKCKFQSSFQSTDSIVELKNNVIFFQCKPLKLFVSHLHFPVVFFDSDRHTNRPIPCQGLRHKHTGTCEQSGTDPENTARASMPTTSENCRNWSEAPPPTLPSRVSGAPWSWIRSRPNKVEFAMSGTKGPLSRLPFLTV